MVVGVALVLLHLLLKWEDIALAVGGRQMAYGAFSLVLVVAVLAILVGVNWYVVRHTKRWDLTKNRRFSLTDADPPVAAGLEGGRDDLVLPVARPSWAAGATA